jgi:CheY-like chemotaxis protein
MSSVLVIDDDHEVREMLRKMLERVGYEVVDASNGKEAIKLYRREPKDLIITDLVMPEKEGIETIIELRHDYPDVKIIAISGGGRDGPKNYLNMAASLGAHYTFAKPFDRGELLQAVEELLNK